MAKGVDDRGHLLLALLLLFSFFLGNSIHKNYYLEWTTSADTGWVLMKISQLASGFFKLIIIT